MALTRSLIRAFAQQNHSVQLSRLLMTTSQVGEAQDISKRRAVQVGANALKNAIEFSNNYIIDVHGNLNMFATVFFAVLDPTTGSLLYINCGHNPPLIIGPDGIREKLQVTDPAVGISPKWAYTLHQAKLNADDALVAFTDGLIDAQNAHGERFGEKRLLSVLKLRPTAGDMLQQLQYEVFTHIGGCLQYDDIALLAVKRNQG
jgi:sigma-B regulation protein RsbU (phosphoserine phosphatase)